MSVMWPFVGRRQHILRGLQGEVGAVVVGVSVSVSYWNICCLF